MSRMHKTSYFRVKIFHMYSHKQFEIDLIIISTTKCFDQKVIPKISRQQNELCKFQVIIKKKLYEAAVNELLGMQPGF